MAAWAVAAVAAVSVIAAQGRGQRLRGAPARPRAGGPARDVRAAVPGHGDDRRRRQHELRHRRHLPARRARAAAGGCHPAPAQPAHPGHPPDHAGQRGHDQVRGEHAVGELLRLPGPGRLRAGRAPGRLRRGQPGRQSRRGRGRLGVRQTDAALRAAHVRFTGRPRQTTYLVRHGVRIALLGFAPTSSPATSGRSGRGRRGAPGRRPRSAGDRVHARQRRGRRHPQR